MQKKCVIGYCLMQAKKDKDRKKEDEQRYNSLRKRVERSLEMGSATLVKMNMIQDNNRGLNTLMAEHDIHQLASVFLSLNDLDVKSTIDILQDALNILTTVRIDLFNKRQNVDNEYADDVSEMNQNANVG